MTANKLPIPRVEVVRQPDNTWNLHIRATARLYMWEWHPRLSKDEVVDLAGRWVKATGWHLVVDGKVMEHQPSLPGVCDDDRDGQE